MRDEEFVRVVVQQSMRDPLPDLVNKANFRRTMVGKGESCGEGFYFDALLNFVIAFAQTFDGGFECHVDHENNAILALEFKSSNG
jgi:hypothetical protein